MQRIGVTQARKHLAKSIDSARAEPIVLTAQDRDLVMVLDADLGRRALAALAAGGRAQPVDDGARLLQAIGDDGAAEIYHRVAQKLVDAGLDPKAHTAELALAAATAAASRTEFGDSGASTPPRVGRELTHEEGRAR